VSWSGWSHAKSALISRQKVNNEFCVTLPSVWNAGIAHLAQDRLYRSGMHMES